jgi:NAD(P)H-hydrate repair Nnr-like enzyme with NAD(P)H-hydrate epimerase domain
LKQNNTATVYYYGGYTTIILSKQAAKQITNSIALSFCKKFVKNPWLRRKANLAFFVGRGNGGGSGWWCR